MACEKVINRPGRRRFKFKSYEIPLHLMLIPGIIFTIIFHYVPIAGLVIAFQRFIPAKGLLAIRNG